VKATLKKYQGFLIDADNTLFDYDRSEKEAFFDALLAVNYTGSPEVAHKKYSVINKAIWKDYEANKIKASDINTERFRLLAQNLEMTSDHEMLAAHYHEALSQKVHTLPYAVKTLEFLSRRATLCLVTNGLSYIQRNRIAKLGIDVFFTSIIISEEIGYSKPAVDFFRIALESISLPAHTVLCVGDNPVADIDGAHKYGIDTCWFAYKYNEYPSFESPPDYTINDLRRLKLFTQQVS